MTPPTLQADARTHSPPGDAQGPLLSIEDFALSFSAGPGRRVRAVDGVSLTVFPRQTVAMVGESGCGKSVTAMSALQLIPRPPGRFDRGCMRWTRRDGTSVDLLRLPPREIRDVRGNEIAMIFQEPMTSLNPVFTVGDQIVEAVRLHQRVSRARARQIALQAMDAVGIPDPPARFSAYPHQFSGGMRQRVMIAMALACEPRLLLADEPTTALDVTIQAQILELLAGLKQSRDLAILLITHDLGIVAENADVVCVMYAGRVVEYANVFDLFDNPLHPYTRGLLGSIPLLGQPRPRLETIRQVVERPGAFDSPSGLRPWWPWHDPPPDVSPCPQTGTDYLLAQVAPGHWLGVWRTRAATEHPQPPPSLTFRRQTDQ